MVFHRLINIKWSIVFFIHVFVLIISTVLSFQRNNTSVINCIKINITNGNNSILSDDYLKHKFNFEQYLGVKTNLLNTYTLINKLKNDPFVETSIITKFDNTIIINIFSKEIIAYYHSKNKIYYLENNKNLMDYNPLCKKLELINIFDFNEIKHINEIYQFMRLIKVDELLFNSIDYVSVNNKELIIKMMDSNLNIHLFFSSINDDYLQQVDKLKICCRYIKYFEKTYSDVFLNCNNLLICKT